MIFLIGIKAFRSYRTSSEYFLHFYLLIMDKQNLQSLISDYDTNFPPQETSHTPIGNILSSPSHTRSG